jgi:prepilin-type N-terminal cleavage/methylation domain-containing protein
MMPRRAFTLVEVLVAIMIFSVVSLAMITIFDAATRIFRSGQRLRAANSEAMAVLNRIDLDCGNAVGPDGGGHFYAWLAENGDCVVGWTVRRSNPATHQEPLGFVLWGLDADRLLRRELEIDRDGRPRLLNASGGLGQGLNPDNPLALLRIDAEADDLTPQSLVVSEHCYHFGVWLMDTSHAGDLHGSMPADNPDETNALARSTYWHYVVTEGDDQPTEPSGRSGPGPDTLPYYTTLSPWSDGTLPTYPSTARFTLILGGGDPQEGRLISLIDDQIKVRGLSGQTASQGSLIRIGNSLTDQEWIGIHEVNANGFLINDSWDDGPLGPNGDGRQVLRSLAPAEEHENGERVVMGRLFTLVKRLRF